MPPTSFLAPDSISVRILERLLDVRVLAAAGCSAPSPCPSTPSLLVLFLPKISTVFASFDFPTRRYKIFAVLFLFLSFFFFFWPSFTSAILQLIAIFRGLRHFLLSLFYISLLYLFLYFYSVLFFTFLVFPIFSAFPQPPTAHRLRDIAYTSSAPTAP